MSRRSLVLAAGALLAAIAARPAGAQPPVPDLGVLGVCVADSASYCAGVLFPGRPWRVDFHVANHGSNPLPAWSWVVVLIDGRDGSRTTLGGASGPALPPHGSRALSLAAPAPFDSTQRSASWRIEVEVRIDDPERPEPADRLANNRASVFVEVRDPIVDLVAGFACAADSLRGCADAIFPGRPWEARFSVYNGGETPIDAWSYDIVQVELPGGARTPLATRVLGEPLALHGYRDVRWRVPEPFADADAGREWQIEIVTRLEPPAGPESLGRLDNNASVASFRVRPPVPDLALGFVCAADSLESCLSALHVGRPWRVRFDAYDQGETPIVSWAYRVDRIDLATGDRVPLVAETAGPPLPAYGRRTVEVAAAPFEASAKGTSWRIEVSARVVEAATPEPPERQANNVRSTTVPVRHPIPDLAVSTTCVVDSSGGCTSTIFPGRAWGVLLWVTNAGETAIDAWSWDADLVDVASGTRTALLAGQAGAPLPRYGGVQVSVPSPRRFGAGDLDRTWRLEVRARLDDPAGEPPERQGNNRAAAEFRVRAPESDLAVAYVCLADSQLYCDTSVHPGRPWAVRFEAGNVGETDLEAWSYDLTLVDLATGDRAAVASRVPGPFPLPRGRWRSVEWSGGEPFDADRKGTAWQIEVQVRTEPPAPAEPAHRLENNLRRGGFDVRHPIVDLATGYPCVATPPEVCTGLVHPGGRWSVRFDVAAAGEEAIAAWFYDVALIDAATGERTLLVAGAAGPALAPGEWRPIEAPALAPFGAEAKDTYWRLEVAVRTGPGQPESPDRLGNNVRESPFHVRHPISDLAVGWGCAGDTAFACREFVAPGPPWTLRFEGVNLGESPIAAWSYDVTLIDPATGARTPLDRAVAGTPLGIRESRTQFWRAPAGFDSAGKDHPLRVEISAWIEPPDAEPLDRRADNRRTIDVQVRNPIADIAISNGCLRDSLAGCGPRLFPGRSWSLEFHAQNRGERDILAWSYDVVLVDDRGGRTALATSVPGPALARYAAAAVTWRSPLRFASADAGRSGRIEVAATIDAPAGAEPDPLRGDNRAELPFVVRDPVADLAVPFACVADSLFGCASSIFPDRPWAVSFAVVNAGEAPVRSWSYDVVLVDSAGGGSRPLATGVAGPPLSVGEWRHLRAASPLRFTAAERRSGWRVQVEARIDEPGLVEPPEQRSNNHRTVPFEVRDPVTDLALHALCPSDTLRGCGDVLFPGRRWGALLFVANLGERAIDAWTYDLALVDSTGTRHLLVAGVPGQPLPRYESMHVEWTSPAPFDSAAKGGRWTLEAVLRVLDASHPEPADRLADNRRSAPFEVRHAVPDLSVYGICVGDSLRGCSGRVFPGEPWQVLFTVHNPGEKAVASWSYDLALIETGSGARTVLAAGVAGEPLPVYASRGVLHRAGAAFDSSGLGTSWEVEVVIRVDDPDHPEPPDRQGSNRARTSFQVVQPVPDLAVWSLCAGDSASFCSGVAHPGRPWQLLAQVFNPGETPITAWSYDVVRVAEPGGEATVLAAGVPGEPIGVFASSDVVWTGAAFDSAAKGSLWRVRVVVRVDDPQRPEPQDRLGNNQAETSLRVGHPAVDLAVPVVCLLDSTESACLGAIDPGVEYEVAFLVLNQGALVIPDWSYRVLLVGPDDPEPLLLAEDTLDVALTPFYGVPIRHPLGPFRAADHGVWRLEVHVAAGGTAPDTVPANDRFSVSFEVRSTLTAALLSLLEARAAEAGIELRWRFSGPAAIAEVVVERGVSAGGPWTAIPVERREEEGVTVALDREAPAGEHHYRLRVTAADGGIAWFGPVAARAAAPLAWGIEATPNPSPGRTRVVFAVPWPAAVRVSVHDLLGREVAVLAEGPHPPGRHEARWDGRIDGGRAPAGLYFVRFRTPAGVEASRLVLLR